MSDPRRQLLHIYLDDHWAGAGGGSALARRLASNNADTPWSDALSQLANEVEADERTLEDVRTALGAPDRALSDRLIGDTKRVAALAGERLGRFKLNGSMLGYSPLSRVLEVEAMMAGVEGKRRLWSALAQRGVARDLASFDFEHLQHRADTQLDLLRTFHHTAAAVAFGPTGQLDPPTAAA